MANVTISPNPVQVVTLSGVTGNTTVSIPAGYAISAIHVKNNTANAVTGGVKIGTTDGGVDVVVAQAVGASAILGVFDAAILLKLFSTSAATTLYVQAVGAWNSANLNVWFVLTKLS